MLFKEIETPHSSLQWAKFFLNLGRLYGKNLINENTAQHTVIKLPYTDFIPQIISLGVADQLYSEIEDEFNDANLKEKLLPNTTIYYRASPDQPEEPHIFLDFNENDNPIIKDMKKNPMTTTLGHGWQKKIRIANEQVIYKKSRALQNKNLTKLKKYYTAERLEQLARLNEYRIVIIGNETKIKHESEVKMQDLNIYSWLLMRPFLHQQSYYLTDIYSSKYKEELEVLPSNTLIIYASLDAFYNFHEDEMLEDFPSIILYSPFENAPIENEALSIIAENLETFEPSTLLEERLTNDLPKGVEFATWMTI